MIVEYGVNRVRMVNVAFEKYDNFVDKREQLTVLNRFSAIIYTIRAIHFQHAVMSKAIIMGGYYFTLMNRQCIVIITNLFIIF